MTAKSAPSRSAAAGSLSGGTSWRPASPLPLGGLFACGSCAATVARSMQRSSCSHCSNSALTRAAKWTGTIAGRASKYSIAQCKISICRPHSELSSQPQTCRSGSDRLFSKSPNSLSLPPSNWGMPQHTKRTRRTDGVPRRAQCVRLPHLHYLGRVLYSLRTSIQVGAIAVQLLKVPLVDSGGGGPNMIPPAANRASSEGPPGYHG